MKNNYKKHIFKIILLIIIIFSINIFSNIIIPYNFSEILLDQTDSSNWIIELYNDNDLDRSEFYYLTSKSDTAYFKENMNLDSNYIVITIDSLKSSFSINPKGDIIKLHDTSLGLVLDIILFGNVENYLISAPDTNQSMNIYKSKYRWYLDNSPTIGKANDLENAKGNVDGFVLDNLGNPVQYARVIYGEDYNGQISDTTDSNGYYNFNHIAATIEISASKNNYVIIDSIIQILPDDTIAINFTLYSSNNKNNQTIPTKHTLFQNYPNPFNPKTTIDYYLVKSANVRINIYDIIGSKIKTLINENQSSGIHSIQFDGNRFASGIYYYQLLTPEYSEVRKMVLIK